MDYLMKIQDAVSFIENNLTENISLDMLAKRAGFSPYYFHRLFQSFVGEAVMEYVRRKRLLCAADEIINTDSNIIDIAMKYCFNSHDVFGRAFKRLFGVTPNEYRNINRKLAGLRNNYNAQEEPGMYDLIIGQKLQCTNIEKKECLETLKRILEFASLTRKEGIFALEQEIENQESNFMKKALTLIAEGYEPSIVRKAEGIL